jgi:threonyl-tRNA synthetase
MIHRALFGSVERFMAVLVEHYAGAFPLWLAPEQARVLPVRDTDTTYANEVVQLLKSNGFRVALDQANEPLGNRIRRAKLDKLPYVLVVGDEDVQNRTLGVNARRPLGAGEKDVEVERGVGLDDFVERMRKEAVVND